MLVHAGRLRESLDLFLSNFQAIAHSDFIADGGLEFVEVF
jgi:hypothetical protein